MNTPKQLITGLLFFSSLQLNAQATLNWTGNYGGTKSESIRTIQPAVNGNYWIGANSASKDTQVTGHSSGGENGDAWIYQIDTAGNFLFAADCLGGSSTEDLHDVIVNDDGSLLLIVESDSEGDEVTFNHGLFDAWIVKTDSLGVLLWQKSFGGDEDDAARAGVRAVEDDGYVFGGYSSSSISGDITNFNPGVYADLWFWKMDEDSSILWQSYFGGSSFEWTYNIAITSDGNYISAASSGSNDEDITDHHGDADRSDIWIVKFDLLGNLIWSKSAGGTGDDYATGLIATSDGGVLATGYSYATDGDATGHHGDESESDMFVVKLDAEGNIEWARSLGGSNSDAGSGAIEKEDGYLITGNTFSNDGDVTENAGDADLWIVKLNFDGNLIWQQTYGGSKYDSGRSIFRKEDQFFVSGYAYSSDGDIDAHIGGVDNNKADCWLLNLGICDIITNAGFEFEADFLSISFENTSEFGSGFYWDFGDGSFSTEINPVHEYASDGDYMVCLIAEGHCENDTICQLISVSGCNVETIAGFAFETDYLLVSFSDTSLNADSVLWDFGDGTTSTIPDSDHNYPASGIYTVCLIAYGVCFTDTICYDISVSGCDIVTISQFSFLISDHTVSFADLSENADSVAWIFGDGTESTETNPDHTYFTGGNYVTCQFAFGECNLDTICKDVFISDKGDMADNVHPEGYQLNTLGNGQYQLYIPSLLNIKSIKLINTAGQIETCFFPLGNLIEVNLEKLPQGIYSFIIFTQSGIDVFKLVR
jgi:PKD repeat protein